MSVDNFAEVAVPDLGTPSVRKSVKDGPPVIPMSDTRATLRAHPTCPLLHRPYYCSP